ncbi:hypothetical protein [Phascolarctobacterium succinatutens]|uniref:hypothetical protein n=1 Tax=Phascolarctobacterium succinatutens TaxID=626940 RepID=UPI0026EB69B4|nr:hypothetical protein [Phascolarctobacterium succinatutens]
MTKMEQTQNAKAVQLALFREHVARITPAHTAEDLANHFAAAFFAAEALNAEAQGVCRCYIAYTDIFKAETREKSTRLDPIRDAIRAAGYSNGYDPTSLSYDVDKREHVCTSFTVGPWGRSGDWRNRVLNGDYLRDELKRLEKEASGKSPAEIISDAEAAADAWQMLKKQQEAYKQNITVLRKMLQAVTFDDWNDWKVNAY